MADNVRAPVRLDKWEVEDAARALTRAEEVKSNKKLFGAAQKELVKQQTRINRAIKSGKRK